MSLFNYLHLQEVEPEDVNSELDDFNHDEITLEESIDGAALDRSWSVIIASSKTEK